MKKIVLIALGAAMLAGCTPREQQLAAAGVVGAAAGAIVASEATRPQPVYVEERRYAPPPRYIPQRQCYRAWERTPYGMVERTVCR
jgi:hypothetical protein